MLYLSLLLTRLASLLFPPEPLRPLHHRLNLLPGSVSVPFRLHRCTSCGRATAAPVTCHNLHRHCFRCEQRMALQSILDTLSKPLPPSPSRYIN